MSTHESVEQAKRKRQQKEQMLVGASMMFIMDDIPGLGQVLMAFQALDYIDNLISSPPDYNALEIGSYLNCTSVALNVLEEAGISIIDVNEYLALWVPLNFNGSLNSPQELILTGIATDDYFYI